MTAQRQDSKCRQVARIIKHLRCDLEEYNPKVPLPSAWLIDATVGICPVHILDGKNWQATLVKVLNYLIAATAKKPSNSDYYPNNDGYSNIHFNNSLFDEDDCHQFYLALLDYLSDEFDEQKTDAAQLH